MHVTYLPEESPGMFQVLPNPHHQVETCCVILQIPYSQEGLQ